jgi:hypothetical protein
MILKLGKTPADVTSYRPISLLPTIAKVLENLILNKLNQESDAQTWIPDQQVHSTIQQSLVSVVKMTIVLGECIIEYHCWDECFFFGGGGKTSNCKGYDQGNISCLYYQVFFA